MRSCPRFVPARMQHALDMQGRLRRPDCDEALAATGLPPDVALHQSLQRSSLAWAVLMQGRVEAVFGVGNGCRPGVGVPWMLGTDVVSGAARWFVLHSDRYIRQMLARYRLLTNMVDARNTPALRWLRRCGFCIEPAQPYGPFGLPFHPFSIGADNVRDGDHARDHGTHHRRRAHGAAGSCGQ